MAHLKGIIPPVPTPFTASGELDLPSLQALLETLAPQVDGFLILGSNGEAPYLSEEERQAVLRAAREAIPKDKVMLAGTGGEATALVTARTAFAAEVGADYALILPPHYYQGRMTDAVLARHYEAVADESPLPVLLYNVPGNTTIGLSPALVESLSGHENIVGLKDSSGNIGNLTETMRRVPEGFTVLTGNAPTLLPALSLGVKGGILAAANVVPGIYRDLIRLFGEGKLSEARALQLRYNPLALAVTLRYGVPGLKAVLRMMDLAAGYPRAPLLDVTDSEAQELKGLALELGLPLPD